LHLGLIGRLSDRLESLADAVRVTARQGLGEGRRVACLTSGQARRGLGLGPERTAHPVGGLRSQVKDGNFRPMPVPERMIPKAGGKLRRLGIATITDRVVQASLKLVLEPIFEADFLPCSYGFRPNRRAHDAVAEVRLLTSKKYEWIVGGDIKACCDEISHSALMERVRARIGDKRALALVKAFLKAAILNEDDQLRDDDTGTPQGSILSPLLSNVALGPGRVHRPGPRRPRN
jgi:group II intron reverse transcriptase/maturase